ncbi:hypothetical protein N7481_008303 [Penicillium waksmanii]|uniref:uncharacterized protein n=1 Tax=Penicillium waksmanii TaxID=69791 RepID=UPI002548846B|nr:uncharacterized protein N7481_008303 [Penicillium waksmanii]KAJ5981005.1 hypothetical protein N7481_008303 [Penicillium waksmanii]
MKPCAANPAPAAPTAENRQGKVDRKEAVVRSLATGLVDGVSEWWGFSKDRHSCSSSRDNVTVSLDGMHEGWRNGGVILDSALWEEKER